MQVPEGGGLILPTEESIDNKEAKKEEAMLFKKHGYVNIGINRWCNKEGMEVPYRMIKEGMANNAG